MELVTVAITGIVVSVLTSLFKTVRLSKSQRSALALGMSVLGGLAMTLMSGDALSVDNLANTIVATFTASQVVYTGILRNTSLNSSLESFGFFSSKNEKIVKHVADDAEAVAKKVVKKKAATAPKSTPKKTTKG